MSRYPMGVTDTHLFGSRLGPVGPVATCRQLLLDSQMDQQRFMVLAGGCLRNTPARTGRRA